MEKYGRKFREIITKSGAKFRQEARQKLIEPTVERGYNRVTGNGERRKNVIIWLDKYRIVSMLGDSHRSGDVFLAEHIRLQTRRVIKRIRKTHPFYSQLAREADILGKLDHPSIPKLHDVEEDDQYLYFIEEFIEGISLKDIILSNKLGRRQIVSITLQICKIIHYLHQQQPPVYYLDLKPEHVILSGQCVYLIDFGSAVSPTGTVDGMIKEAAGHSLYLGTKGYAPPELFRGEEVGTYSDVYGIGSILKFLLQGNISPEENRETERRKKQPGYGPDRKLWRIIQGCRQENPAGRLSLQELEGALTRLDQSSRKTERGFINKLKKETVSGGKYVIGLIGTHPGAGVTHIGLLLSFYLAGNTGLPAAYLEYHSHGDCVRFLEQKTICNGPDLIPDVTPEMLAQLLNEDYRYYVIDFGCDWDAGMTELLRCDKKIIVTQNREWKQNDIRRAQTCLGEIFRPDDWQWIYNLEAEMRDEGLPEGICFPWEADVCRPSARAERVLTKLISRK